MDIFGPHHPSVALTSRSIIEEQRVNSIVLEYSHFWSAKLKTLAEDMSAKGYDGYFLGTHCILPFSSLAVEVSSWRNWMSMMSCNLRIIRITVRLQIFGIFGLFSTFNRGHHDPLQTFCPGHHGSPGIFWGGSKMEWWHDVYEVCAKIKDRIYRGMAGWCWLNVVFLLRGSRLSRKAWQWVPVEGHCTKTLLGSQKNGPAALRFAAALRLGILKMPVLLVARSGWKLVFLLTEIFVLDFQAWAVTDISRKHGRTCRDCISRVMQSCSRSISGNLDFVPVVIHQR